MRNTKLKFTTAKKGYEYGIRLYMLVIHTQANNKIENANSKLLWLGLRSAWAWGHDLSSESFRLGSKS